MRLRADTVQAPSVDASGKSEDYQRPLIPSLFSGILHRSLSLVADAIQAPNADSSGGHKIIKAHLYCHSLRDSYNKVHIYLYVVKLHIQYFDCTYFYK